VLSPPELELEPELLWLDEPELPELAEEDRPE
jgi:hypothetical protein